MSKIAACVLRCFVTLSRLLSFCVYRPSLCCRECRESVAFCIWDITEREIIERLERLERLNNTGSV